MLAVITGATGLIGRALCQKLEAPRVTSRDPSHAERVIPGARAFAWPAEGAFPVEALEGADVVIHLSGEPIAEGRLTAEKKRRVWASRVDATRSLAEAFRHASRPPKVLISGSAVGFYGDRGDDVLAEDASRGQGYLADVCSAWEREALALAETGVRVCVARTGLVLDPRGGALKKMLPPFRLGAGATLGSGAQWMPWIHHEDEVNALLALAKDDRASGAFNLAAPHPVTQRVFAGALAHAVKRPLLFRAPAWVLKAALGDLSDALLGSQRCVPKGLEALGFGFRFAHLDEALRDLVSE